MINDRQLAMIAKMYYIDKVKQNEIAKYFNISSMMVSRILKEAENTGIVKFHVKMPWQVDIELSGAVKKKFGLKDCYAFNIPQDEQLSMKLGSYLADYFVQILPKKNAVVGLSWGNTISKFIEALPYIEVENCSLIQLTGAFTSVDSTITPTDIINLATKKLNSRLYVLNAPLYAGSREMRDNLMNDPVNTLIMKMADKSDINIIGLSDLSMNASTCKSGVIDMNDYKELVKLSSIGDLAGTFLDKEGIPIQWSKSNLNTGAALERISKAKQVICVAGEARKLNILRKTCGRNYFNVLFITSALAEGLLK
jgi:DNA-binding transcriptional regulator LsrR (DeoR family)